MSREHKPRNPYYLANERIEGLLRSPETNITVPEDAELDDVIAEVERNTLIASGKDAQVVLVVIETEENAKRYPPEGDFDVNTDAFYVYYCWADSEVGPYAEVDPIGYYAQSDIITERMERWRKDVENPPVYDCFSERMEEWRRGVLNIRSKEIDGERIFQVDEERV